MRFVMFYHSLTSDWNHGNAHFLRGVATELLARGHDVRVYEPVDAWSRLSVEQEQGRGRMAEFAKVYPGLRPVFYHTELLDLDEALDGAEVVIVHEWNEPGLVRRVGRHRARRGGYRLLFHDTHHRSVTDRKSMAAYDLSHYDGVLAFGGVIRDLYLRRGWARRAWTWHEAADVRVFKPEPGARKRGDLVWIGNWGDGERTAELREFLLGPVKVLGLTATVYGVRYPPGALRALRKAGIQYGGWLPNYRVPGALARHRVTVHVPRRPYAQALPGIPTIRVFEALACGIPLLSAPWKDSEGLFEPNRDFLFARDGREMQFLLDEVLSCRSAARRIAEHGRQTILSRHTCAHRVDELLQICAELGVPVLGRTREAM